MKWTALAREFRTKAVELLRRVTASDVSSAMIGTVVGQLVVVVGSPILTRLYSPADLGGLAVFLALASTLSVVSALGYQLAIPLPTSRAVAANVAILAVVLLLGSSLLVTLVGFALRPLNVGGQLSGLLWMLGPSLLAITGYQILFMWTTREGKFRGAGLARVAQAATQVVGQVGAGLVHLGILGLVAAYVVAQFAGIGRLWKTSRIPRIGVSRRRMAAAGRQFRKFPQFTMWGSLANAAGTQLPAILVGALYGFAVAGEFALALRVLALPAVLLGQAVAQVFYPKAAAAAARPGELRRIIDRATGLLFLISLVCFVPVTVLGRELFLMAFGPKWGVAGEFGRWIAVWSAVALVTSPVSTLYLVAGRQGTGWLFSVSDAAAKTSALIIGGWFGGADIAVYAFALTSAASYLVFHMWTLSLVNVRLWDWFRPYIREALAGAAVVVGLVALRARIPTLPLWLAATSTLALACWPSVHRLLLGKALNA